MVSESRKPLPPTLEDILAQARNVQARVAFLAPLSDQAPAIEQEIAEAIKKVELHIAAEKALLNAMLQVEQARQAALDQRRKGVPGVDAAFINVSLALRDLGELIHRRFDYEAKRGF